MHLLDIFLRLRELGQDRLVYREDVIFEHLLAAKNHAPNRDSQQQDELAYMAWRDERHYLSWRLKQHTGSTAKTAETAKGKK
jgi:hypothetical protein